MVAIFGSVAGGLLGGPSDARAQIAVGATLLRAGRSAPLDAGTALRADDEIRIAPDGQATVALGASLIRLHGGADIRLDDVSADRVRIELLAGRSYHRVSLPDGGSYQVITGSVTWSALGTAFGLDRTPTADGRTLVTLLGLQHAVGVAGPGLQTTVAEGSAATLSVDTTAAADLVIGPIDPSALDDPWLIANAAEDRALGLDLGVLGPDAAEPSTGPTDGPSGMPTTAPAPGAGTATPSPAAPTATVGPTPAPTSEPTAEPTPAATRAPKPTPEPTPRPTPEPTPEPTPKPSPTPLPSFGLDLLSCDGGVLIDWSAYHGSRFDHYATLRNTESSIPKAFPPEAGAIVLDGARSGGRWLTSAYDASGDAGSIYHYRTMAFDRDDRVIGASPVEAAIAKPTLELGGLTVGPADGEKTAFGWTPYAGPADCFSSYKLAMSRIDPSPSVLKGATAIVVSGDQDLADAVADLPAGTYHFRLQVLRSTEAGTPPKFLVAQTDVATYVVP